MALNCCMGIDMRCWASIGLKCENTSLANSQPPRVPRALKVCDALTSTGLEVDALGGAPGVYSARYAGGPGHDSNANMTKLLHELENNNNRRARFRTVIALIINGKTKTFDGIVNGEIITQRRGGEGFGYDPIFQPEGHNKTFAEMGADFTILPSVRLLMNFAIYG